MVDIHISVASISWTGMERGSFFPVESPYQHFLISSSNALNKEDFTSKLAVD